MLFVDASEFWVIAASRGFPPVLRITQLDEVFISNAGLREAFRESSLREALLA